MKKLFMFAATALVLAACTSDDALNVEAPAESLQAVNFDTYTADATRAYTSGVMTTALLGDPGFGVFAYHSQGTSGADGAYAAGGVPNFMYDQAVTYGTSWTYSPLKYWPNETTKDMLSESGAAYSGTVGTSTKNDVLSFFAYAPYVASATSTTPGTNSGINAMMAKDGTTDPWIQYTVSTKPSTCVDLVWGVAPAGGLSYTAVNNNNISVGQGLPLKDLVKPSKDQKIKFLFQHALARIGMTVVAAVDQIAPGGTLDSNTKIYVNSVTLADAGTSIPRYAKLNLNNTNAGIALWYEPESPAVKYSATINSGNELNTDLQNGGTGVTTTEKKVIAQSGGKDQYLMLIPTPGTVGTFDVTIDYDVVTTDAALNAGKSTINNVITKQITLNTPSTFSPGIAGFVNNKAYNLKLILGLTSVKLDAEVADWEVDGSTEVNLPRNEE